MRRIFTLFLVALAACGGVASDTTATSNDQASDVSTTSQADTTTTDQSDDPVTSDTPDTTGEGDEADSQTANLPGAPDFTLELGTGGEYTLSSTDNPVYLVFWAEW